MIINGQSADALGQSTYGHSYIINKSHLPSNTFLWKKIIHRMKGMNKFKNFNTQLLVWWRIKLQTMIANTSIRGELQFNILH